MTIFVRFLQNDRFDPIKGCEVVRFIAMTEKGSYHTEIPSDGPKSVRVNRAAFKEKVVECIRNSIPPGEVSL